MTFRFFQPFLALRAAILFAFAWATATLAFAQGTAAVIGGALRADNTAVWSRLVADAGGKDARWLVIPAASESPEKSAQDTLDT
ncbi:MAG: hypothetical protein JNJ55_03885, partial [Betaproteobacteria bacterium]|nr:hypothetical protein [Betaproteobacteria bacterium]